MSGQKFRISGTLEQTDIIMSNTFWVGVQPALTANMLEYVSSTLTELFSGEKC